MKIKRYVDTDMRQVLRQVRQEQGPDAVILSNRRVEDGIEIIAAVDYDEALVQQALGSQPSVSRNAPPAPEADESGPAESVQELSETGDAPPDDVQIVSAELTPTPPDDLNAAAALDSTSEDGGSGDAALQSLQNEITNMRGMLETQLSGLVWRDTVKQSPMRAQILRNMTKLGIGPDVANNIANRLGPIDDAKELWRAPLLTLAQAIPLSDDPLLRDGGIAALVGPTGVGKTTTIAKLASRYAIQNGASEIALISVDGHRIGAQEQLLTLGNILGVKVYPAEDLTVLEELLDQLGDKSLVLIDTEGTSQRDVNLTARLAAYGSNDDRVRFYLTLSATCQEAGLDETVRVFNRVPLSGAIVTKIDETAQLGCVLSTLIRHDLPAAFVTDGQRIPDDLYQASKKRLWLVNQAVECMRSAAVRIDEDLMVEKFAKVGASYA